MSAERAARLTSQRPEQAELGRRQRQFGSVLAGDVIRPVDFDRTKDHNICRIRSRIATSK